MPKQFWNFKNISETEGELTIYGDIGESWWGDTVSASKFDKALKDLGNVSLITTRINSGGGDVFTGHHIYAALKDHPARVVARVEGLAASAASVIAMAADELVVHATDYIMIHNPKGNMEGESKDFIKMSGTLDTIKDGIVNAYTNKTGKSKAEIAKLMDEATWMTGEDAVREGFADRLDKDEIDDSMKPVLNGNILIVNGLKHDLSNIKTRPNIKNELETRESGSFSFLDKIINLFKDNKQVEGFVNNILENNLPIQKQIENKEEVELEIKNVQDLKNAYPEILNQAIQEATDEAIKNERTRIQDIEKIAKNVAPDLVNKAKFIEPMNAKDLAFKAMQVDNSKGEEFLDNLGKDAAASGTKEVQASNSQKEEKGEEAEIDNLFSNAAKKINERRA